MKNGSAGHDNITPEILKHVCQYLLDPLCHVINLSFQQGLVPNKLMVANVIPIVKSGDECLFQSFCYGHKIQLQAGKGIANIWSIVGLKIMQNWHVVCQ